MGNLHLSQWTLENNCLLSVSGLGRISSNCWALDGEIDGRRGECIGIVGAFKEKQEKLLHKNFLEKLRQACLQSFVLAVYQKILGVPTNAAYRCDLVQMQAIQSVEQEKSRHLLSFRGQFSNRFSEQLEAHLRRTLFDMISAGIEKCYILLVHLPEGRMIQISCQLDRPELLIAYLENDFTEVKFRHLTQDKIVTFGSFRSRL